MTETTTEELVITKDNFEEYFFDVRKHEPKRGQIMASYTAVAEFMDGPEKRNVIDLLKDTDKMIATSQVMRKLLHASEVDSYRVPKNMAQDLFDGVDVNDVAAKPYKYTVELFFYTNKELVPKDDPHWRVISLLNLDGFLDKKDEQIKTRILDPDEVEQPAIQQ